jgi:hypothetical protein
MEFQKFGVKMPICTYFKKDMEIPLNLSKVGCNKCVWQDKISVWCIWHELTQPRDKTQRSVCCLGQKPVRPVSETGQTGFRNRSDRFHPVSPQHSENSETKLIHQTIMHHKLPLSHLETFKVHYTHCSTQYKSSQVQHIDKVEQIIITDPNLSTSL